MQAQEILVLALLCSSPMHWYLSHPEYSPPAFLAQRLVDGNSKRYRSPVPAWTTCSDFTCRFLGTDQPLPQELCNRDRGGPQSLVLSHELLMLLFT